MKASVAGPARTAVQLAPAAVITELLDVFVTNFSDRQYAAVLAGLTLGISYVQNLVEEFKGSALFRD